ncbi:hypothetical protein CLOM621_06363 [Clostridium sp. M62/1]|nr:hypothetical protein CLOM621_06363 [Clostridium sp. M62/1]
MFYQFFPVISESMQNDVLKKAGKVSRHKNIQRNDSLCSC